jgi:hypothetical protein
VVLEVVVLVVASAGAVSAVVAPLEAGKAYFLRIYTVIGTPLKSYNSLSLFSKNRLYGSFTYCGRLQKNANCGCGVGNCIMYFIFTNFPFKAGGG